MIGNIIFAVDDNPKHRTEYGMDGQIPEYMDPNNTIVWFDRRNRECDSTPQEVYDFLQAQNIKFDEFLEMGLLIEKPEEELCALLTAAGASRITHTSHEDLYKVFVLEQY